MPAKTTIPTLLSLAGCNAANGDWPSECEPTTICDGDGCTVVVNIEVGEVSGTLTYDGAPLIDVPSGHAVLTFVPVPRDQDRLPIPMGSGVGREGYEVSVSDGGGRWSGVLQQGTYDVWLNLKNAILSSPVKRRLLWDVQIATGVELGPGTVWDHNVAISTISGFSSRPESVRGARVTWINEDHQSAGDNEGARGAQTAGTAVTERALACRGFARAGSAGRSVC